jgi:Putative peptidoglycan binding domain
MRKAMKIFVVLICSVALVNFAYGAQQEENKPQKKKQAPTAQHAPQPAAGHATGAGAGPKKTSMGTNEGKKGQTSMSPYDARKGKGQTQMGAQGGQKGKKGQTSMEANQGPKSKKGQTPMEANQGQKGKKGQTPMEANQGQKGKAAKGGKVTGPGKPGEAATATTAGKTAKAGKPLKAQKFNLPKQPNTAKAPPVKFQPNKHIEGSQNWQGQQYTVLRNYKSEWHDQNWWHSHYHNNIVFVFGAPYYWNAGYWFPAWGYYPNAYYAWDGPIYGYNHLPPDQVIANVQSALQQQGYYQGEVDGLIGPLTRDAIANYQRDHGLYTTSTIDQPTLQSLGMA